MFSPQSHAFEEMQRSQTSKIAIKPVAAETPRRRGNSWSDAGWRRQILASMARNASPYGGSRTNRW